MLNVEDSARAFCAQVDSRLAQAWTNGVGLGENPWMHPYELGRVVLFAQRHAPLRSHEATPLVQFVTEGVYQWSENEAYVNFANARLGGGIFGGGFVQEEKNFMFETNVLPVLWEPQGQTGTSATHLNALQQLRHAGSLHARPALIGMRRLFSVKHFPKGHPQDKYYGKVGRVTVINDTNPGTYVQDPEWLLQSSQSRVNFVAICMAAATKLEFQQDQTLAINTMLGLATTGFQQFVALCNQNPGNPRVLNTGNWGCGAFGGCPKLSYLIQLLAYRTALRVSDGLGTVRMRYWCYERTTYDEIKSLGPVEALLTYFAHWAGSVDTLLVQFAKHSNWNWVDKSGTRSVASLLYRLSQGDLHLLLPPAGSQGLGSNPEARSAADRRRSTNAGSEGGAAEPSRLAAATSAATNPQGARATPKNRKAATGGGAATAGLKGKRTQQLGRDARARDAQHSWVMCADGSEEGWVKRATPGGLILVIAAGVGELANPHVYVGLPNHKVEVVQTPRDWLRGDLGMPDPVLMYNNKLLSINENKKDAAELAKLVCERIRTMVEPPAVIVCGSVGGQVTVGLVWRTCWRGPTVMLNAGSLRTQTPTYEGVYPVFVTMTKEPKWRHPSFPHTCEVASRWFQHNKGDDDVAPDGLCVQIDQPHAPEINSLVPILPSLLRCALLRPAEADAVKAAWSGGHAPVWLIRKDSQPEAVKVGQA